VKILTVSTSDLGGGAERTAWLLFEAYRARGHDSWLAVGNKRSADPRVLTFHESPHVDYRPHGGVLARRLLAFRKWLDRTRGREDFRFPYSQHLLELTGTAPDIVHCHNLHGGYFDLRVVPEASRGAPVFLTLNDLWTFTGHCAYPAGGCERWRAGCGACPDLGIPPAVVRDGTRANWRRKRRIWARSGLRVVIPCQWLAAQVAQSILAPAIEEARVIPNPVDLHVFRPGRRDLARQMLGLPQDADLVLFVANGTHANRFKDWRTVRAVAQHFGARRRARPLLVLAVGGPGLEEHFGPVTLRHAPFRTVPADMALHYQAADVLLHAAHQEVLPLAILEALACERPVVASRVGGIPEIVEDGRTGWLFPEGDVQAASAAVTYALDEPELARGLAQRGAEQVRRRCDRDVIADTLIAWYERARRAWDRQGVARRPHDPGAGARALPASAR
jgi:glycosyltransferase involved in cell wall biosynthesis